MWKLRYFLLFLYFEMCIIYVNNYKDNKILSRKRRYLMFPQGSNFVLTFSFVKALMRDAPKGVNVLGECDVPFKLPSDTRLFRKHYKMHNRQRRDIFLQLETSLNGINLDGNSCVKRILCEVEQYSKTNRKSMIKDILTAIFKYSKLDNLREDNYKNYCDETNFLNCAIPILNLILGSLEN